MINSQQQQQQQKKTKKIHFRIEFIIISKSIKYFPFSHHPNKYFHISKKPRDTSTLLLATIRFSSSIMAIF